MCKHERATTAVHKLVLCPEDVRDVIYGDSDEYKLDDTTVYINDRGNLVIEWAQSKHDDEKQTGDGNGNT